MTSNTVPELLALLGIEQSHLLPIDHPGYSVREMNELIPTSFGLVVEGEDGLYNGSESAG